MQVTRGPVLTGGLLAVGILFLSACSSNCPAQTAADSATGPKVQRVAFRSGGSNPFPHRVQLLDDFFDGGAGWLNVSGPIELRDLRGKIVVLDFWCYCCINCMHILPDLKFLENKYPREVVVIGVHSAKFLNERDSENIRRAILRYDIEHPVINDSKMMVWQRIGANSWPTFVVIDPEGKGVALYAGEGHRADLDATIAKLIAYHSANGTLDRTPLKLGLERNKLAATPLKFPGKVLADEKTGRLFIADSNHNRIVICTLDGKLTDVAGAGPAGEKNGSFDSATFHHPQGMALDGEKLYVADTENHLIRVLDLEKRTVASLAGTGHQAPVRAAGGHLHATALSSPWDVLLSGRTLYIAMAGSHQIWSTRLGTDTIHVLAGTGAENILNGLRNEAAFAQPSGLATDGHNLYVADSEGSAIRKIPFSRSEPVSTLAGTSDLEGGRSLFEFGDVDGTGSAARFQHPMGLAYHDGRLFVADSYNHKVKTIDIATGDVKTLFGSGQRGDGVDPPQFAEPGGLSVAAGKLYIADTNNHVIKVADLATGHVTTFSIEGLKPPKPAATEENEQDEASPESAAQVEAQRISAGDTLRIELSFNLPAGYKLNESAPASFRLRASSPTDLIAPAELAKRHRAALAAHKAVVSIPLAQKSGKAIFDASLSFTYCRDGVGGVCKLGAAHWTIPIEVTTDAKQTSVNLTAAVHEN
jgi:DNA-binding beta-propeller fold protein YncE